MAVLPKKVVHETPDEFLLSSVIKDIDCPRGCQRTFATTSALQMHLTKVHNDGNLSEKNIPDGTELWYHCPIERCIYNSSLEDKGKHFTKLKYVKQHYQKVHAERSFLCECSSSFSTASLLAQHRRLCGIQMMCSCNRTFGSLESLQTHVRRENHTIHPSTTQEIQTRKMMQPSKIKSSMKKESGSTANPQQRSGFYPIIQTSPHIYPANCSTPIQITRSCDLNSMASVHLPPTSIAQVTSLNHTVGKLQQPIHLLAAVALSELSAHTGIKRAHCVEVAIQTDISELKFVDKSSSPECNLEIGVEASCGSNKQLKRSAETQTRLTLRDCKKIRCESPFVDSSTTVSSRKLISNSSGKALQECELVVNNYLGTSLEESVESEESSLESLTLQVDLPDFLTTQQSTSGTQTSPRAPGSCLNRKYISNKSQMKYSMDDFTFSVLENVREDQACMTTAATTTMSATQTPNYLDSFAPGLFDDDDDDEELMAAVVGPSSSGANHQQPTFGQNPSSSIETQTDHDVLLSSKAGMLDENDIILTSTETQTDPSTLLNPSKSDNPCQGPVCTGETQTCEDFSQIEQFLYSTIHTQTTDSSQSELFPELSFNDSHTQTGLDDTPGLVTTHTQTPYRG